MLFCRENEFSFVEGAVKKSNKLFKMKVCSCTRISNFIHVQFDMQKAVYLTAGFVSILSFALTPTFELGSICELTQSLPQCLYYSCTYVCVFVFGV